MLAWKDGKPGIVIGKQIKAYIGKKYENIEPKISIIGH
jgi:hypothetical protein